MYVSVVGALLEKKTELDKRGLGISDYSNGLVNKSMSCRPSIISKDSSSDRPTFLDKVPHLSFSSISIKHGMFYTYWCKTWLWGNCLLQDGGLADDAQTSPFMPSPSLKLPLASAALPGQSLGVTMQNLNNRQVREMRENVGRLSEIPCFLPSS